MRSKTWADLVRKLPPNYHDSLLLVTSVGIEITIQVVMRVEDEYLVIRGRLGGTTDTGRLFFIPYDQINCISVLRSMPRAELSVMFGESPEEALVEPPPLLPAELPEPVEEDLESTRLITELLPPVPVEESPKPVEPPRLSKAELLARIRSRSLGEPLHRPSSEP